LTDEAADAGGQSGDLTPVSEPAVREVKFPNGNVAPLAHGNIEGLAIGDMKGAFIQIMQLTWHSFLLPLMDRHPGLTI